jgi:Uncharacterized protein conserved in bacteria
MEQQQKRRFARSMRNRPTKAEKAFWMAIRKDAAGRRTWPRWHRQHIARGFILDFWCPAARVGVEVDGSIHLRDFQRRKDRVKDAALRDIGILVIRCTNEAVLDDAAGVTTYVRRIVHQRLVKRARIANGAEPGKWHWGLK